MKQDVLPTPQPLAVALVYILAMLRLLMLFAVVLLVLFQFVWLAKNRTYVSSEA